MSNALNVESGSALGGPQGIGMESGHAAGATQRANGRISANSFRLLTAKLKGLQADELALPGTPGLAVGDVPHLRRTPENVEATAIAPDVADPLIAIGEVQAAFAAAEPVVAAGSHALPNELECGEAGELPPPCDSLPAVGAAEGSIDPEPQPIECAEPTAQANAEPVIDFVVDLPTASEIALPEFSPITWQQPAVTAVSEDVGPAPGAEIIAEAATEAEDLLPEGQSRIVAVEQDSTVTEAPTSVYDDTAIDEITEAPRELASNLELESAEVDAAPLPDGALPDHPAEDDEPESDLVVEAVDAPAPLQEISEPAPQAVVAEPDVAASDVVVEVAVPQPQSELAGRVVDAMLKTISTAIYAKPTASERAAFLKEIAEQMARDAEESGETVVRADQPAIEAPAINPEPEEAEEVAETLSYLDATSDAASAGIGEALAERLGPSSSLLKSKEPDHDPFAEAPKLALLEEPTLTETAEADSESGELALTLLDMMSGGSGSPLPHERTLASDTLLRILPRIPVKPLLTVVDRMSIMESPPPLLVAKLIRDPRPEVVAPLLERCSNISDQDLMNAAPSGDSNKLRMIARRRTLSQVLSDYLISTGEPNVLLTLIRNPGAALSHDAFYKLAEQAGEHHALLAPLATRADLPPPVAFELFWNVPTELRRFIFSRFLTDSETLNKILRITLSTHGADGDQPQGEPKFAPKEAVDRAIESAVEFRLEEAAQQLADIGGIGKETALRILSDREGEPIAVLLKALGYPRTRFEDVLVKLRATDAGLLRPDRKPDELQAVFDSLSFNKARILLTYWDWFVRKAGPYAPHN